MIQKNSEKCISPWLALLIIIFVCLLMLTALFWGSKGEGAKKKQAKGNRGGEPTKVDFIPSPRPSSVPSETLLF